MNALGNCEYCGFPVQNSGGLCINTYCPHKIFIPLESEDFNTKEICECCGGDGRFINSDNPLPCAVCGQKGTGPAIWDNVTISRKEYILMKELLEEALPFIERISEELNTSGIDEQEELFKLSSDAIDAKKWLIGYKKFKETK